MPSVQKQESYFNCLTETLLLSADIHSKNNHFLQEFILTLTCTQEHTHVHEM